MNAQQKHQQEMVVTYFRNKQLHNFYFFLMPLGIITLAFLSFSSLINPTYLLKVVVLFLAIAFAIIYALIIGIYKRCNKQDFIKKYYAKRVKDAEKHIQRMRELQNTLEKEDDEEQQLRLKGRMLQIQKKLWKLEFECNLIDRKEGFLSMIKIKLLSEQ